ncbi:hypothetical protein BST25_16165 [Mycobacterium heidelbergense]|uniref:Uncharacterized protein n=1 Tax=Mycobacterium heidelbergense TaxID=53376 RepID=A0A1X0DHQ9_MYCHE|nr:hypothetical protein BST25_16165 [Mycobacterium heidelbergense]
MLSKKAVFKAPEFKAAALALMLLVMPRVLVFKAATLALRLLPMPAKAAALALILFVIPWRAAE